MVHRVILPKLGTNIDKARIAAWLKKEGDEVARGDVLAQVETDKAVFEVEAEAPGILRRVVYPEGSEVAITRTIAIIASEGEDIRGVEEEVKSEKKEAEASYAKETWKEWFSGKASPAGGGPVMAVRMSPAARAKAKERGIDMQALQRHFAGRKEVIGLEDVEEFTGSERLAVYGAGLGAKQVLEVVRQLKGIEIAGLIDDNPQLHGKEIYGYPVLGGFSALREGFLKKELQAVALSFHSEVRRKIFMRLKKELPQIPVRTLIDPRAIVSSDASVGEGVFIEAGAVIGPGVKIGDGVIVDLGAVVCHDCSIGAHCHLSPGCALSGIVSLRENVLVGVGASVNSTVTVGENTIITPGSAVMNDVQADTIVSGIPAVAIGESRRGK